MRPPISGVPVLWLQNATRYGILRVMERLNISLAAVSALCLVSACAFSEDMAGVLRIASETNCEAIVEMPFTPFGDGTTIVMILLMRSSGSISA